MRPGTWSGDRLWGERRASDGEAAEPRKACIECSSREEAREGSPRHVEAMEGSPREGSPRDGSPGEGSPGDGSPGEEAATEKAGAEPCLASSSEEAGEPSARGQSRAEGVGSGGGPRWRATGGDSIARAGEWFTSGEWFAPSTWLGLGLGLGIGSGLGLGF